MCQRYKEATKNQARIKEIMEQRVHEGDERTKEPQKREKQAKKNMDKAIGRYKKKRGFSVAPKCMQLQFKSRVASMKRQEAMIQGLRPHFLLFALTKNS